MGKVYDPAELEVVGPATLRVYSPDEVEEVVTAPVPRATARDVAAGQLAEPGEVTPPLVEATGPGGVGMGMRIGADSATRPTGPSPAQVKARAYGAAETVSWGGADEAVGLGKAIVGKGKGAFWERYAGGRDEYRAGRDAARTGEPDDYTFGRVAGALAQPGAAGLARGVGARLGIGVGEGLATGALSSEHDLTKGDVKGVAQDAARDGAVGLLSAFPGAAGTYSKSGKAERSMWVDVSRAENAAEKAAKKGKAVKTFGDVIRTKLAKAPLTGLVDVVPMVGIQAGKEGRKVVTRMLGQLSMAARSGKNTAGIAQFAQDLLRAGATEREIRLALDGELPGGPE